MWCRSPRKLSATCRAPLPRVTHAGSLRPKKLRRLRGDNTDVGDVVSLLQRWNRVYMKYHPGGGCARYQNHFAEIVRDVADLHAFLNIRSALHQRIPNARALRNDIDNLSQPNWIFDE